MTTWQPRKYLPLAEFIQRIAKRWRQFRCPHKCVAHIVFDAPTAQDAINPEKQMQRMRTARPWCGHCGKDL